MRPVDRAVSGAGRDRVWEGRFLAVEKQGSWEYAVRTRDIRAAVILALDGDHVILIEQFRIPVGARCLELPAGLVGDEDEGESIETAAARELEEETGYRADRLEVLGTFCSSPGMTSETFTVVRATQLTRVGEGGGEETENIIVHRVALADLPAFIADRRGDGYAMDAKLLILLGAGMMG